MNSDETILFVRRYRASVEDVATPALDQVIMAAAGRQAAKRRFVRRTGGAFFVTAITVLGSSAAWHFHQSNPQPSPSMVSGYGTIEGLTRPYLLQAGTDQYSGPGLTEGAQ